MLQITNSMPGALAVSVAEAAKLTGHSESWIRKLRRFGPLVPARLDGRQAVTADSLAALMRERRSAPLIRLVVDNTL